MANENYAVGNNHGKKIFRCLLCRFDGHTEIEIERHMRAIHKVGAPSQSPRIRGEVTEKDLFSLDGLVETGLAQRAVEPPPSLPVNGEEKMAGLAPQGDAKTAEPATTKTAVKTAIDKTAQAEKGEK